MIKVYQLRKIGNILKDGKHVKYMGIPTKSLNHRLNGHVNYRTFKDLG